MARTFSHFGPQDLLTRQQVVVAESTAEDLPLSFGRDIKPMEGLGWTQRRKNN